MKSNTLFLLLYLVSFISAAQTLPSQRDHHQAHVAQQNATQRLNFSESLYNLMQAYDVKHYFLDLNVEAGDETLSGSVTITAEVTASSLATFAFELHNNYTITAVEIEGTTYNTINTTNNERTVGLNTPLTQGTRFAATITYNGEAPVDRTNDDGFWTRQGYTFTLSQPYGTADWLPVKQLLEDRAEEGVDVSITTTAANKVATVGLLQNTVDVGGGKLRYEYTSNYPIVYYLIAFAVGEYEEYTITANPTGAAQPIPIQNFVRSTSELSIFQDDLDATADMLVFFSDLFGLYPFHEEKYGHVRVPAPFSLENQMMSAMATFDRKVIAHELAHQWFGNVVALKSFSHIWLNEGLGTYAEYLYLEEYTPKEVADAQLATWTNRATLLDNARGTVYVTDSLNTNDIFDLDMSYYKAAMVWHMMRYLVNDDEVFFQAMKDYYNTYQNKNVDTWDMAASFQTSTGIDFTTFLEQWIYGEGYPNYTIEWNWENGQLYIKVDQRTSSEATPFFEMPLEFEVTDANDEKKTFRVIPTANSQLFTLDEATAITELVFDPTTSLLARLKEVQQNPALNGVTSLTPSTNDLVQVYPNPVEDFLYINIEQATSQQHQLQIFNTLGQLVWQKNNQTNNGMIDISMLPEGIYTVKISAQEMIRTFKIVKK